MTINHMSQPLADADISIGSETADSLCDRYRLGERNFADQDFCGLSLASSSFSYANFRRAKLKQVDWCNADLRGIDLSETDLSRSQLCNADLRGAALNNCMLFMASLQDANLQGADLSGSSLDITTLGAANLQGANLCGTYLCGIDLTQVNLTGAYFDDKTQFDPDFEPKSVGMQNAVAMTLDEVVTHLNQLSRCASRYLGGTIALKYWEKTRFNNCHLAAFHLDAKGQFSYSGPSDRPASLLQLKWSQLWMNRFIGSCALVLQELPTILEQQHLLVMGLASPDLEDTDNSTDSSFAIFGESFG